MFIKVTYDQDFDDLMMHLRAKHGKKAFDVDGIGRQLDMNTFSKEFFTNTTTTADISTDSNSNVDSKDVIAYNFELPKPFMRYNSYYILWKKMKQLYGHEEANKIIEMQLIGDIYINDFTDIGRPYCFNYSTYDIMLFGLPMVKKIKSVAPKYLYAFKSQLEQFVVIASNSTLGAAGLADLFIVMSHYVKKILDTKYDAHFKLNSTEDCWNYVRENLVSFIYTINQPMRGNQCVTEDTEVLTPNGFKKHNELLEGEDIYTWSDGKLNIQPVEKVNVYDYDGEMHKYSGRDTVQVVTPNHKVLFKKNNSDKYELKESLELIGRKTPLTYPVAMLEDDRPDFEISDDLLKLCVMTLTDGNIDLEKNGRVRIFKSPKRWGNEEIESVLKSLSLEYRCHQEPSGFGGLLNHYDITTPSSQTVLDVLNRTKNELPSWFSKLSKRQANIVIDLWAKFDGCTEDNNYKKQKCQCDNYKIADQLQHVCFLAGRGSKIKPVMIGDNKKETIYLIPYYRVNKDANKKEIINYKGKVWCPTTKDGIVVFRKDGMIFVSGNSPFTNVSVFDRSFLESMCDGAYHGQNGEEVDLDVVMKIQELYLDIMNDELERTPITFPVTTACFSVDNEGGLQDEEFLKMISEKNMKFGFINIYCGKTSTLSSCCRLRSDTENEYFNSFGAGSTKIGSLGVVTMNLPRLSVRSLLENEDTEVAKGIFYKKLEELVLVCGKINNAKRHIIKKRIENGNLPLYEHGYMELSKQYSTSGVTGLNEICEIFNLDILKSDGQEFIINCLDIINSTNDKLQKRYSSPHNCEQVPAENSSIKLATKDKMHGLNPKDYNIYSNQFIPLVTKANMLDRIELQGLFDKHFSGGAIAHINIGQQIEDPKQIEDLIKTCAKKGVVYWAINYNLLRCENNHITVGESETCTICNGKIIDVFTRVVGFLTNVKNWHEVRRNEDYPNRQWYGKEN